MENDELKRNDQIKLLQICRDYTDTGDWKGTFTYPNCGVDLVKQGLVTEDRKITQAGRVSLWLLGKGEDPTDSISVFEFDMKVKMKAK